VAPQDLLLINTDIPQTACKKSKDCQYSPLRPFRYFRKKKKKSIAQNFEDGWTYRKKWDDVSKKKGKVEYNEES